jgi:uncharacterized repeat protein (TIGR02543 family)
VPVRAGYEFAGWFSGATQVTAETVCNLSADQILTAQWTATALLRVKQGNDIKIASGIYVKGGSIRQVTALYSVENGVVKQGV